MNLAGRSSEQISIQGMDSKVTDRITSQVNHNDVQIVKKMEERACIACNIFYQLHIDSIQETANEKKE